MIREVIRCRICGNDRLESVLDLGPMVLTGYFPKDRREKVASGPLELVKCMPGISNACGLVQLRHTYDPACLYGIDYGYRSGLNASMAAHVRGIAREAADFAGVRPGDVVVDIGSNDGTLLAGYSEEQLIMVGVDPTAEKYAAFYPEGVIRVSDLFSADLVKKHIGSRKAKVITAIAMFYDLESPATFVRDIGELLAGDGVWVLEQSYLPRMIEHTAYDTVCHEHAEYYGLRQIKGLMDAGGFKIVSLSFNEANGGSLRVIAARQSAPYQTCERLVNELLSREQALGFDGLVPFAAFKERILRHRDAVIDFFASQRARGRRTIGYGASTKGNVILQFCGVTANDLPAIVEINPDKFGAFTPGTGIPIVAEEEGRRLNPDTFFVLPWHFRDFIVRREERFLSGGGSLFFPLPEPQMVMK